MWVMENLKKVSVTWAVFLFDRVGADTCYRKLHACKCLFSLHFWVVQPCVVYWAPTSESLIVEGYQGRLW